MQHGLERGRRRALGGQVLRRVHVEIKLGDGALHGRGVARSAGLERMVLCRDAAVPRLGLLGYYPVALARLGLHLTVCGYMQCYLTYVGREMRERTQRPDAFLIRLVFPPLLCHVVFLSPLRPGKSI